MCARQPIPVSSFGSFRKKRTPHGDRRLTCKLSSVRETSVEMMSAVVRGGLLTAATFWRLT